MATFKPSNRQVVAKKPLQMLFTANREGSFSLEEVLDGLWNSPLSEVTKQAVNILTTFNSKFHYSSSLRTRAWLRDTIFHDEWPGDEKVYELLFSLYLNYSRYWWGRDCYPDGISSEHFARRRYRVFRTAQLFLVKLYCAEHKENDKTNFGGFFPVLKVFLKPLMGYQSVSEVLKKEEQVLVVKMLLRFTQDFEGVSKCEPKKEGEWFDRAIHFVASFCEATHFYDQEVLARFRRIVQAVERGALVGEAKHRSSIPEQKVENQIVMRQRLAVLQILCETIQANKPPLKKVA